MSGIHAERMIRAFERLGWTLVRSKGAHHALAKPGRALVIISVHKGRTMKEPTAKGIPKQAGLSEDEFLAAYR